jgi:hypothetical protein
MDVWISAEIDFEALNRFNCLRIRSESLINSAIASSELSGIDLHIRYIPIVMDPSVLKEYPPRSKFSGNLLISAPQLDIRSFLADCKIFEQIALFFSGLKKDIELIKIHGWEKRHKEIFIDIIESVEKSLIEEELMKRGGDLTSD